MFVPVHEMCLKMPDGRMGKGISIIINIVCCASRRSPCQGHSWTALLCAYCVYASGMTKEYFSRAYVVHVKISRGETFSVQTPKVPQTIVDISE